MALTSSLWRMTLPTTSTGISRFGALGRGEGEDDGLGAEDGALVSPLRRPGGAGTIGGRSESTEAEGLAKRAASRLPAEARPRVATDDEEAEEETDLGVLRGMERWEGVDMSMVEGKGLSVEVEGPVGPQRALRSELV